LRRALTAAATTSGDRQRRGATTDEGHEATPRYPCLWFILIRSYLIFFIIEIGGLIHGLSSLKNRNSSAGAQLLALFSITLLRLKQLQQRW
jgi:hypothetical protein